MNKVQLNDGLDKDLSEIVRYYRTMKSRRPKHISLEGMNLYFYFFKLNQIKVDYLFHFHVKSSSWASGLKENLLTSTEQHCLK